MRSSPYGEFRVASGLLPIARGGRTVVQWLLLEQDGEHDTEQEHRNQVPEDRRQGVHIGLDDELAHTVGQSTDHRGGQRVTVAHEPLQVRGNGGEAVGEASGEHGADDRGAQGGADLPEEVVGRGDGANLAGREGILDGE